MSVRVVDGNLEFAMYEITDGNKRYFAFDETELALIKEGLDGVSWVKKNLSHGKSKREKALGVKYSNRSEALEHLEQDKEPEHLRKHRLETENADLKARIERLEKLIVGK